MRVWKLLFEFAVVVSGSALTGFMIGTLQHYVSFGVWGYGFGIDAFWLARFEGGLTGMALAIPTGLIAYYVALKRNVSLKQALVIVVSSLVAGCGLGAALFWPSAFLMPIVTIGIAYRQRRRHKSKRRQAAALQRRA